MPGMLQNAGKTTRKQPNKGWLSQGWLWVTWMRYTKWRRAPLPGAACYTVLSRVLTCGHISERWLVPYQGLGLSRPWKVAENTSGKVTRIHTKYGISSPIAWCLWVSPWETYLLGLCWADIQFLGSRPFGGIGVSQVIADRLLNNQYPTLPPPRTKWHGFDGSHAPSQLCFWLDGVWRSFKTIKMHLQPDILLTPLAVLSFGRQSLEVQICICLSSHYADHYFCHSDGLSFLVRMLQSVFEMILQFSKQQISL